MQPTPLVTQKLMQQRREKVGDDLIVEPQEARDVVREVLQRIPENSFYAQILRYLNTKNLDGVEVRFGMPKDFPQGQLAVFRRRGGENSVLLNRDALNMSDLQADSIYSARVIHAVTHELAHAVTHKGVDNSPELRQYYEALMRRARQEWKDKVGGALPPGLKVLAKQAERSS
jgi:hypothetical protein